jgi:hypothetical protein
VTIKKPKSSKNCFCRTSYFLKGSFVAKKLNMELEEMFDIFLKGCLSSSLKTNLTPSKKEINYYNGLN